MRPFLKRPALLCHGRIALLGLVGFLPLLSAATVHAAEPQISVLGLEAIEVPEPLAQGLTDALRQRAAGTTGLKVLPGKDLIEMKMVFGCDENAPTCMAQAGRSLGADKLLYGTLRKGKGGNIAVALRLLDVKNATIERQINESVARKDLSPAQALAARYFSTLVDIDSKPVLNVISDTPGAHVDVDGMDRGATPVTLRDLSPGTHTVAISQPGREATTKTIELRAGGTFEINVQLEAAKVVVVTPPPLTPPPPGVVAPPSVVAPATSTPPRRPGRVAKIAGITAGVAAVVMGAVAIYTWRTYSGLEDTAHGNLETMRSSLGGNVSSAQRDFFQKPSCNVPDGLFSGAALDAYKQNCSSGQSNANATTALWVVAGALAAGGVVALVVGDHQDRKAAAERQKKSGVQQSLQIVPVFGKEGGGVQAAFEF